MLCFVCFLHGRVQLEGLSVQGQAVTQATLTLFFYSLLIMLQGRRRFFALCESGGGLSASFIQSPTMLPLVKIVIDVRVDLVSALETQPAGLTRRESMWWMGVWRMGLGWMGPA